MRYLIKLFGSILLSIPLAGLSQSLGGRVLDGETKAVLPYVNIGILKGERGTVTNAEGFFYLDLNGVEQDAVMRFSFIGYESLDLKISTIDQAYASPMEIELIPKTIEMSEVVVYPREYVEKVVGNPNPLSYAFAGFANDSLGYEMGVRVRLKKRPTILKALNLHGLATSYDTVFYRINVYEMIDGHPGGNILNEPIYVTLTDFKGRDDISIDLNPYHIVVHDDFVISLEYVKKLGEGQLQLNTGVLSGRTFVRKTSQGEWHSLPLGLGMSVLVRYQK